MSEKIEMTCPCGATFKVESQHNTTAAQRMHDWLAVHGEHQAPPPSQPTVIHTNFPPNPPLNPPFPPHPDHSLSMWGPVGTETHFRGYTGEGSSKTF